MFIYIHFKTAFEVTFATKCSRKICLEVYPRQFLCSKNRLTSNIKRGSSLQLCGSLHFEINPRVGVQIKTLESEGAIMFAIPLMNVFQERSLRFHRLFKREKFSVVWKFDAADFTQLNMQFLCLFRRSPKTVKLSFKDFSQVICYPYN